MALEDTAPHGPFTMEVKIHLTNGEYDSEVSFDCPPGHAPAADDLAVFADKALDAIAAHGDDWRLQTRDEFVQKQLSARAGAPSDTRFAVPEGNFSMKWAQA